MKTAVAVLIFNLICLTKAQIAPIAMTTTTSPNKGLNRDCAPGQVNYCSLLGTVRDLEDKLNDAVNQLDALRRELQDNRVAFGASIGNVGFTGPFSTEITLKYKHVYTNSGAYNPETGVFTAPVKGVYYFSFTGHNLSYQPMGLRLMMNGQQVVTVYNHVAGYRYETATNGMILQLEVGDQVYMTLRENTWIFDNVNDHSTFIGHLVYAV